jgi:hypothetical protein
LRAISPRAEARAAHGRQPHLSVRALSDTRDSHRRRPLQQMRGAMHAAISKLRERFGRRCGTPRRPPVLQLAGHSLQRGWAHGLREERWKAATTLGRHEYAQFCKDAVVLTCVAHRAERELVARREAHRGGDFCVSDAELVHINIDVQDAIATVLAALPALERLRVRAATLPLFDASSLSRLEDAALALGHARTLYLTACLLPDEFGPLEIARAPEATQPEPRSQAAGRPLTPAAARPEGIAPKWGSLNQRSRGGDGGLFGLGPPAITRLVKDRVA